jgi:pyruvate/2-oxoglutarate dehydrogenase complex dihydrolipoamide acyltransferase (E2) component
MALTDQKEKTMTRSQTAYEIVPFPPLQQSMIDWLELEHRRHTIHALLDVDITEARRAIRAYRARTGGPLSLMAFLTACLARAVAEDTAMQACRLGRQRLVLFADVDVGIMVEREVQGDRIPLGHVIRAANRKSLDQIQQEIQRAKEESPATVGTRSLPPWLRPLFVRGLSVWLALPAAVRRWIWAWALHDPYRRKRLMGTVGLTAVGMFGCGAGWGIAPMAHPLSLVVGGLVRKPGLVGERTEAREYLCLTLSLDHDVINGAPAARFAERLKELIEGGAGLHEHEREPAGVAGPR